MMEKGRVHLSTDRETKHRIALAARRRNLSVTDYCMEAIRRQLADDGVIEVRPTTTVQSQQSLEEVLAELRAVHQEILAHNDLGGTDVVEELNRMREERDLDLSGMH